MQNVPVIKCHTQRIRNWCNAAQRNSAQR